jgi:muramoyltetrapeptide carboxypeptidase LdcA involved in peptidoglycan recycling
MIKYPEPLKRGDTIGICAPSRGVVSPFTCKLDNAKKQLNDLGYHCVETQSVRKRESITSNSPAIRAIEFESLYFDSQVKAIIPPWGGEFLMDMLPFLNFESLKKATPKWVMGFSDISTLLFTLTLNLNIATAHGPNFLDFGSKPVHDSVWDALKILNHNQGEAFEQENLDLYQKEWLKVTKTEFPPYNLTEPVEWKILGNAKETRFSGRLIGGNLDVLCKLIGTPFAPVKNYLNTCSEDGIIWYFESCEMNTTDIYRTLWQMKMNHWFEDCQGFIFGRSKGLSPIENFTLEDALRSGLEDLNVPVVYDVDLGHLPPQLTFINGAYAACSVKEGKGIIKQKLI